MNTASRVNNVAQSVRMTGGAVVVRRRSKMDKQLEEKRDAEAGNYRLGVFKDNPDGFHISVWANEYALDDAFTSGFDYCFKLLKAEEKTKVNNEPSKDNSNRDEETNGQRERD